METFHLPLSLIHILGRDLDPNIDLWQTAKPFLKRWMSEQIGWRSVANTVKKELPFIVKNLPQMPRLVHQFLQQQTHAEQEAPMRAALDLSLIHI